MSSENTNRESQRIRALATEYRRKGYKVTAPRESSDAPEFLRPLNYVPDLIATSAGENLVIEVRSRQTAKELSWLSAVAERVNAQSGWQFVLVFTNPKKSELTPSFPTAEKTEELLRKSRSMGSLTPAHVEAAFLFAWSALEATVRLLPTEKGEGRPVSTPWTLIRDAAMEGLIARDDALVLERLFKLRNSLLHAGDEPMPVEDDVESLRRITEELLHQWHERVREPHA